MVMVVWAVVVVYSSYDSQISDILFLFHIYKTRFQPLLVVILISQFFFSYKKPFWVLIILFINFFKRKKVVINLGIKKFMINIFNFE